MSEANKKSDGKAQATQESPFAHIERQAENNSTKVNERYLQRITFVRRGRDFYIKGDIKNTLVQYNLYFRALGDFFGVGPNEIHPKMFNRTTDTSEALLITQVSWDLARIYENSDKFDEQFKHALNLFVNFSMGYKFQVANAEMLRKFVEKNPRNKKITLYKTGYSKIKVISKKCYVATHCFGEHGQATEDFRDFRYWLLQRNWGTRFVQQYYRYSPLLVFWLNHHPKTNKLFTGLLIRPALWVFSKMLKMTII